MAEGLAHRRSEFCDLLEQLALRIASTDIREARHTCAKNFRGHTEVQAL
jgi:hypothetical protein